MKTSESQLIEYKESWRDVYLKCICGFSNAQGGVLYIGKRDDGSVVSSQSGKMDYRLICKEYGIAEPEYTVHPNDIMMMFKANDTVNDTVKTFLALIEQNPSITYEEMTEKTGKSRRTVSRMITELKEKNIIARVGSDKNGYWEIVNREKCEK